MRNLGGRKKPTPRRIEPKSTFGMYIPADTPQEACDFLNALKDKGSYSTDVVEIIVQYLEVRKFLNAADPLDGVSGNLLDQIQTFVQRMGAQTQESEDRPSMLEDAVPNEEAGGEEGRSHGPGFDLNKMLQRMRRNKQLGSVNHLNK